MAAMIVAVPRPGLAQQQNQGSEQGQGSQKAEHVAGESSANGSSPAGPLVVLSFDAQMGQGGKDVQQKAFDLAKDPHLAVLQLSSGKRHEITGKLAFQSIADFQHWAQTDRKTFFDAVGGENNVTETMRITRPRLERTYGLALDGLDAPHVEYIDKNNRAAGDADLDAVTVMCEAGADCKANN